MSSSLGGLALALAVIAIGVAGYVLVQDRSAPPDLQARLDTLEARMARMEEAATAAPTTPAVPEPTLGGLRAALEGAGPDALAGAPDPGREGAEADASTAADAGPDERTVEEIREIVDVAVKRKAEQLLAMADKKPTIDVFAKTLELTDEQRRAAEQEIVASQHEIRAILETPTADGTIFLDELVEVIADGMVRPGESPGRWAKFIGRLLTENYPGTNETYAVRAEGVKARLRESFKREWTQEQYARFTTWQMDPTEVKDIDGSPWKELEPRVIERARQLGADIPERE